METPARFEHLSKALRLLREQRGWSQKELATVAGMSGAMLSNYETAEKQPSLASLGRLLDALGVYLGGLDDALEQVGDEPLADRRASIAWGAAAPPPRSDVERIVDVLLRRVEAGGDLRAGLHEVIDGLQRICRAVE
jgi:transcriptional regulator with XRE-family HTH domain